jgi:hypothetical protein
MPANSSILRALIAFLLIVLLLPFSRVSGAGTPLPELLSTGAGAAGTAQPGGADLRTRSAVLNLAEVERTRADLDAGRTPGELALSLFADTSLVARFEHIEHLQTGGYTLTGKIDGSPFAEIHLSVVGSALFASVNTPQGLFRVSAPDGQMATITQVDPNRLPPEEEQVPTAAPAAADTLAPAAVTTGPSTTDDGSRIDVYVGYTATARVAAGGAAAIQAIIATAISETNTGYANSRINQRVVLVGSGEYAYSETSFNWNTALSQWSNPADAVFGPAHTLRNTLKADEMVLLVNDPTYCGLAWLMTSGSISTSFAASSFAVVNWTCATGYYSFGHEMGHNMGAHHDRITAGAQQGAYPYSYGYQWFDSVDSVYYRTVMAYNVYGSDIRINYWSNPNVSYLGRNPTGVGTGSANSAYNALTLNNTAPVVAMFRDGDAPAAPSNLTVTSKSATSYRLDWTDNSTDEMRFRIERTPSGLNSWTEIGTAAANATTYTDNTGVNGTIYQYRVLSDNGNGRSVSNIATSSSPSPLPPSGLTITSSSLTSAALSWADNSNDEILFRIKRAPASTGAWSDLGTVGANVTTYTDNAVPDGSAYRYQVFAETASTAVGSNITDLPAMPVAPTALTATGLSQTSVRLDWTDNATSEDGYKVERAPVGGAFTPLATLPGVNGITYTDASIPASGEYQYRVYAYNTRGNSGFSGAVNGLPAKPATIANSVINNGQINLSWADSSVIESGYKVDRSLDGGATYQPLANLAANVHAYNDTAAACGTQNSYRVFAFDPVGSSPYATTSGTTAPCKPVVTATPGTTSVFLSWAAVSGAQGYTVEKWDNISSSFLTISPLISLSDPTAFVVSGLAKATSYQFRVVAKSAINDTPSDPINVLTMSFDTFIPLAIR